MSILSVISWKTCYNCGQSWYYLCPQCLPKLDIYEGYDYVSKKPSKNFSIDAIHQDTFPLKQVIVLTHYHQKWVKALLRHAKFYWKFQAYNDIIIPFSRFFQENIDNSSSLLIPVPLHFLRRWRRWFNQSQKIADILSQVVNISVDNKILYRSKYTKHQSQLSKSERQTMLHSAFYISKNIAYIPKDTILYLVDDVVSSGSTLVECAKTLKSSGFTDVRAVVLASD